MATISSNKVSVPGPSSPQVRACQICAVSKAKCISRVDDENGKCERARFYQEQQPRIIYPLLTETSYMSTIRKCHRLNKECLPGRAVKPKARRPRTNRTAKLEEKLDGLVSLLTAAHQSSLSSPKSMNPITPQSTTEPNVRNWVNVLNSQAETSSSQAQSVTPQLCHDSPSIPPRTPAAYDQLRVFQTNMASHFPFIVIPSDMSAEELHDTKPFLYQNIMMVTSYPNVSRQLKLRAEVVRTFSEQVVIQGKKTLDLLQGILIFIGWYHHYLGVSPLMTSMTQLANALVFGLGLHKSQLAMEGPDLFVEAMRNFSDRRINFPRSLEERRTFLGLFCLSRALSTNIGKIEPLQITPYVEECCLEIEKQHEYPSDQYLVFQIRFQIISDAAIRSFPFQGVDYWSNLGTAPVVMLVKSLESDVERFKSSLNPELMQSTLFQIHLHSLSIHNTEIALRKTSLIEAVPLVSNQPRLALLTTCLQSTTAFFSKWLSIPSNIYPHLPITFFSLVAHAAFVLAMLNLFQYEGWDLAYARQTAPFSSTIDELAQKYEEVSQETDSGGSNGWSAFRKVALRMRSLKDWYDARLMLRQGQRGSGDIEVVARAASSMEVGVVVEDLNDGFWNEVMAWTAYDELI